MQARSVIAVSILMVCVGYFARLMQEHIYETGSASASPGSKSTSLPEVNKVFELEEVQARRRELDGQVITVVGGACIWPGQRPVLVADDDDSLLVDPPGAGRYMLSMPEWRFRDMGGVFPRCAVTGRFDRLDDNVGFDSLSPIESISWGSGLPARKGDEEPSNKPWDTTGDKPAS